MKKTWSIIRQNLATIIAVAVFYILLFAMGITCPIKFIFGISCPGCGMTRAMFSAVLLRFSDAFALHPLWFLVAPTVALMIYFYEKDRKGAWTITIFSAFALLVIVYIIRLVFFPSDVVSVNIGSGLIGKLFKLVISVFK